MIIGIKWLALLVVVGLVYLSKHRNNHSILDNTIEISQYHQAKIEDETKGGQKCQPNMHTLNIKDLKSIPSNMVEFLKYRHCRHFPTLLDSPGKCRRGDQFKDVFLLLVIKSSPGNYERREVLRKTWARERQVKGRWIRRVFIVGTADHGYEKVTLNNLLEVEQQEYNDIIQWDFNDTFLNLTLKQVLFMEWLDQNCPNVQFLLNCDDDVFVNTNNIIKYLQSLDDKDGSRHLYAGYTFFNGSPSRSTESKYFVPYEVQKSDWYPPYCAGAGYLLSAYTAAVIREMSHSIILHPIDDVYVGICMQRAGLRPTPHPGFRLSRASLSSQRVYYYDPCLYTDLLVVHRFLPPYNYLMWNKIVDPNLKCN